MARAVGSGVRDIRARSPAGVSVDDGVPNQAGNSMCDFEIGGRYPGEMNVADSDLLRLYGETGDQEAFTRLMGRHVDLVYSAALRQTGDDSGAAEEVTQTVFADLARKSLRLVDHPCLAGWLYSSTRLAAAERRRAEGRRRIRETQFAAMTDIHMPATPPPEWSRIRPVLDAAMAELAGPDREAVVLRFFEGESHADIGRRYGISENTARMRISRALEKLRLALEKRGVVSAAEALGLLLGQHAVASAPADLIGRIGPRILARSDAVVRTSRTVPGMLAGIWTTVVVSLLTLTGIWIGLRPGRITTPDSANVTGSTALDPQATGGAGSPDDAASGTPAAGPAAVPGPVGDAVSGRFLILTVVARDSGAPIPNVLLDHLVRSGPGPQGIVSRKVGTTRAGVAWIWIPTNVLLMDVTTRTEGFSDTRLRWEPPLGQRIPTHYTLQLDRAVTLGGHVVDSAGNPVLGANVEIFQTPRASEIRGAESHEFGSISATTDDEGKWNLTRVASDVLTRCRVQATHPDHQPSESIDLGIAPGVQLALKQQTQVLRLAPGRILRGTVVDPIGQGIAEARVAVAYPTRRDTLTSADGEFELPGCPAENHWINVTAAGFAPARFPVRPALTDKPIQLALERAGTVRLRVLNAAGQPVSNAWFAFSVNPWEMSPEPGFPEPPPRAAFADRVDADGYGVWTNAPVGTPRFDVAAEGYERRFSVPVAADGVVHDVLLERAANLVVHGEVRNADTGRVIPAFRMALGYLLMDLPDRKPLLRFLEEEQSWLRFEGGRFSHSFTEPLMKGTGDSRVVVKVEAEGFQSWFSRPLQLDEGDVRLEVALKPAEDFSVTVLLPDGRPAVGADVGLVRSGDRLWLDGTHFSRSRGHDPTGFRTADLRGQVRLTREVGVPRLLVAHPGGFTSIPFDSLSEGSEIILQPWGRIEVEFLGRDPAAHHAWVHQPMDAESDLELEFQMAHVQADEHGRGIYASIPPGEWDVSQVRPVVSSAGPTSSVLGKSMRVQLGPGETSHVVFDDSGYRVIGKIRYPSGFTLPANPNWFGRLSWDDPALPKPPSEILGDREALAQWAQQPGFREVLEVVGKRSRFVAVTADGGFTAESVEPGDYRLELTLMVIPENVAGGTMYGPPPLLAVQLPVHLPAEPDSGVVDLGWVSAEAYPTAVPK